MADKSIADLPVLQAVDDTTQIPVWQPGATNPAQKLAGSKFREFAEQAAEQYVEDATQVVQRAEQALDSLGDSAARAKQSADNAAASERKAKLYADQTEASVSGVASFNGRGGHVMPQTGDYTADMVGAAPAISEVSKTITDKGWYRVGILSKHPLASSAAARLIIGTKRPTTALPADAQIVDVSYGTNGAHLTKIFDGVETKQVSAVRGYAVAGVGTAIDIYYATDSDSTVVISWQSLLGQVTPVAFESSAEPDVISAMLDFTEWLNPPMQLGVEYRTTERWKGKPVYVKLVDFGALPNAGLATKDWSDGDSRVRPFFICGLMDNGNALPYFGVSGARVYVGVDNNAIYVTTENDRSKTTAAMIVKYIKTSD